MKNIRPKTNNNNIMKKYNKTIYQLNKLVYNI